MRQYEAVIQVMRQNGGYATLGHLYQSVLKVPNCKWSTKTPFASIRRIVQTYPHFFKIRPGLWALTSERDNILRKLAVAETTTDSKAPEFNHSYYQGLVVEIGNLRGYETFVPNQDKNKPFLGKKLSDVSSTSKHYNFTYEHLTRRSRTVDVTWFNDRKFPKAFFEIEHSTDIQDSLLKFLEFQDFKISFCIVADTARHTEFKSKLAFNAFAPIRTEVKFVTYESLAELHSKISASATAQALAGL